ncbi:AAA family ATPase [Nocardioides sp.]|uniref:helix-turn-helix transcriptional regulator n=1 Tax=Nocardioides sp. TaxID=35761 RepID=UPI0035B04C60
MQHLIGRELERAALRALVEHARHGTAGSLVLRGDPGVGKSALLEDVVEEAAGTTVLRTRGLEVEAPLAFAALHRLLRPLARLREQLPGPQAGALAVAFGEDDGTAVEPFLVGVATLSLLTAAGEEGPVLCVVDDAHWLDPASAGALLFCARRLGADRVALVFGARSGSGFDAPGVEQLVLGGLDDTGARQLLAERWGTRPTGDVVERLVAETRGNPLALLELPGELTAAQLEGAAALPAQLHLTDHVEQVFLDRCRRLPEPVQRLLLLAAADDTGRLDVLSRASALLGADEDAVQAALDSGLLQEAAGSVALRHPLVRSAVYQASSRADRRRAHRAIADALAGAGEPDREVWHRAHAAEGQDERLVEALADVGARSQRRGGYVAALAAYERAAELSADRARRAALLAAGARSAWACGQAARARTLLASARDGTEDPILLCDLARLRGHIEVNIGSASEAHRIFVEAAHDVLAHDPGRALEIGAAAAVMRTFGADSGTPLRAGDLLEATDGDDSARSRCLRQLLVAMTHAAESRWAEAVAALDLALALGEHVDDRDVLWNLGNAALQLGDDRAQHRFYSYALSRARESGAVTGVVYCLQRLCFAHYCLGDLVAVRVCAEEAVALAETIGQPAMTALPVAWLTLLAAEQGRDDHADLARRLDELLGAHPLGITADPVRDLACWAAGARAVGEGDLPGAVHHFARLRMPFVVRMTTAERVEAAARAGDTATAASWTDGLAAFAEGSGRPWAVTTLALGRALTAADGEAEPFFREAVAAPEDGSRRLDVARARLAYGEWLRRSQRRVDARQQLRPALDTFREVRLEAMADRAEQELRSSGETARKRDPSTLLQLTPTELTIARLVSSGMSNKDVAAQCWISPRTVAFHLRNIFAKAGVTSRGELARLDLG